MHTESQLTDSKTTNATVVSNSLLVELEVEWSWKWSNPGSDKDDPDTRTSDINYFAPSMLVEHSVPLSADLSSLLSHHAEFQASCSFSLLPSSSSHHHYGQQQCTFQHRCTWKIPSHLLPHLIPLSSEDFFLVKLKEVRSSLMCISLGTTKWKENVQAIPQNTHRAEGGTFLVGKKEHPVTPNLWTKPLGWGEDWSWTFPPHPHLCHRNCLVGRNAHGNKRAAEWSSHGECTKYLSWSLWDMAEEAIYFPVSFQDEVWLTLPLLRLYLFQK